MKFSKEALIEAVKEGLRVYAISALPVLIAGLRSGKVNWQLVLVTGLVGLLRALDKYLHKLGKETENEKLIKGLTRF